MRKNCSSDREKRLKFEAEGREFAKFLISLKQFIQTVKGKSNSKKNPKLYYFINFMSTRRKMGYSLDQFSKSLFDP